MRGNIPEQYLTTWLTIIRATETTDDTGNVIGGRYAAYSNILADIQQENSNIEYDIHGRVMRQTHTCYLNRYIGDVELEILPGDWILDIKTGEKYWLLGIEKFEPFTRRIEKSGYYQLALSKTDDARFEFSYRKYIYSKARITNGD